MATLIDEMSGFTDTLLEIRIAQILIMISLKQFCIRLV